MKLDAPITYRLDNIYYDFDKANLRPESEAALDKLLRLLYDNPQLEIELSSHTDSRGGNRYNQKLSERRAKSVVDYLIGRGITPQRMKPVGYGELVPIAPNDNPDGSDNPEGRQLNRRTEFKIISKSPCYPGGYSPIGGFFCTYPKSIQFIRRYKNAEHSKECPAYETKNTAILQVSFVWYLSIYCRYAGCKSKFRLHQDDLNQPLFGLLRVDWVRFFSLAFFLSYHVY